MRYEVDVRFHRDFIEVDEDRIVVGLTSKPEQGRANRELIKKLAKHFNIPQFQVRIVSGLKSKLQTQTRSIILSSLLIILFT